MEFRSGARILRHHICRIFLISAILLLIADFNANSYCTDASDSKMWLEQDITYGIADKLSYKLIFDERFFNNISTWEELYVDTGFDYKPTSWLVLGPRYRHIWANFNSSKEIIENRYHMNVELIAKLNKVTLESRSRYEYRIFEDTPTRHRFMERIRVAVPLPWEINGKKSRHFFPMN